MSQTSVSSLTTRLRERFDASFGEPPHAGAAQVHELLALRAGGEPYALRLRQTLGLYADRPVTALPGPAPALLGVAAFSGTIVPVYDLGVLLGGSPSPAPRWLVLAAGPTPLAVAFAELDGHLRVAPRDVVAEPDGRSLRPGLSGMVTLPGGARPLVDLPAVRALVSAAATSDHHHGSGDPHG